MLFRALGVPLQQIATCVRHRGTSKKDKPEDRRGHECQPSGPCGSFASRKKAENKDHDSEGKRGQDESTHVPRSHEYTEYSACCKNA